MTLKLAGQRFGRLLAVRRVGSTAKKQALWLFRCDCGAEVERAANLVSSGQTTSCGCLRVDRLRDSIGLKLAGQRFGRLLVLSEVDARSADGGIMWRCACDCGGESVVAGKRLVSGSTTSCGCRKVEAGRENIEARRVDYSGMRFGRLLVESMAGRTSSGIATALCRCDCGGSKVVPINSLSGGRTISCGCAPSGPHVTPLMPARARNYLAARGAARRALLKGAGGTFTGDQVEALRLKQRGRCAGCGVKLGGAFHRDHRVPLALGGSNDITNIQLLCVPCNQSKGAKPPEVWASERGLLL